MLSSVSSSMFFTSRACSITCWPSRTSMPSFCSSNSIGGSTTSTPSGMFATPSAVEDRLDLLRRVAEQRRCRRRPRRACPSSPARQWSWCSQGACSLWWLRRRAEVPDVRVAVAGEQRVARELVARPLADHRAGGVADVVLVEAQQRAQARVGERGARAREAVVVQPPEIDPLLEIDLRVARRLQRPVPVVVRIDVVRADDLRLGALFAGHRAQSSPAGCHRAAPRASSDPPRPS